MPFRLDVNSRSDPNIEATSNQSSVAKLQQAELDTSQLATGQVIQAKILSASPNGVFTVSVGSGTLRMNLPAEMKVGTTFSLQVTSTTPRLTLMLSPTTVSSDNKLVSDNTAESDTNVASTQTISNLPKQQILPNNSAEIQGSSTTTSISDVSRLIDLILRLPNQSPTQAHILENTPIVPNLTDLKNTVNVASILENKISQSGIFYESHLSEWAVGEKSKNDLINEPQSRLPEINTELIEKNDLTSGVNREIIQLVQQQLHLLENENIKWQGEIFPGQKIEWDIRRENRSKNSKSSASPEIDQWQSEVKFELPTLGTVSATINLIENRLKISVASREQETTKTLKIYIPELIATFTALGITFDGLIIKTNDHK